MSWTASIAISPEGAKLAFKCENPGVNLFIVNLATDSTKWIPSGLYMPEYRGTSTIAWSPDGKTILDDNLLTGMDSSIVILPIPPGLSSLGWAANGWVIVGPAGFCGTGVYWMEPKAGAHLVKLLDAPYRYAAFSPDGTKLLALTSVCTGADTPRAVVLDSRTLKVEVSIPGATWAAWQP